MPTANTIGAKLDNRLDLRAALRTARKQLKALRDWAAEHSPKEKTP